MDNFGFNKRVLFIGVPDMALVGLDTLIYAGVNIVGVIGPKKTHNTYSLFKQFVYSRRQNFIEYDSLDSPDLISKISELQSDIAVVFSFNDKIPKVFIDSIKDGIINVHPSLLPNYRGGNPYSWVIINDEKKTGVTLHYMTENFDEGNIILQEEYNISDFETMGTIFNETNNLACQMVLKTLIHYEKGIPLDSRPQEFGDFIKAPNINEQQSYIDFNRDSEYIERFVRALNPYISATTLFRNQVVKVHKVCIDNSKMYDDFDNGQICEIINNKVYIKTQNGCIIPEIMQYSGFFIGNCEDFIKIVKPEIGDKFTNEYT